MGQNMSRKRTKKVSKCAVKRSQIKKREQKPMDGRNDSDAFEGQNDCKPAQTSSDCPFYPIHHIGFVYSQYLPYTTAAYSTVVHFDRQLSGFFWILVTLRVYRVIYAALLTFAALAPRCVVPCLTYSNHQNFWQKLGGTKRAWLRCRS